MLSVARRVGKGFPTHGGDFTPTGDVKCRKRGGEGIPHPRRGCKKGGEGIPHPRGIYGGGSYRGSWGANKKTDFPETN